MGYAETALDQKARTDLHRIGQAEILIGIPSFQSVHSIGQVVKACLLGLAKYFPERKGVVFVAEGGEADAVRKAVAALPMTQILEQSLLSPPEIPVEIVAADYLGRSGKGTAIRAILEAAGALNVQACAVVDSDLRSISPEWMELLITPILEKGFGFVTPYYCRHKYDGTITNLIAYPLTRALYGRRVRQPIGGDFGFSPHLAEVLVCRDVWDSDIARFGIDIWMTTVAMQEKFKICQSFLGAKIHEDKDPGKHLAPMFSQVVGTLFTLMGMYEPLWRDQKGSRPTAIFGFETEVTPKPVTVDVDNLVHQFESGVREHRDLWQKILEPTNYYKLMEVARGRGRHFELPTDVWVRSVYDFAVAFQGTVAPPELLLQALVPIYFAAVATFVEKTRQMDSRTAEAEVNEICEIFEELKPYLTARWQIIPKRRGAS